ncbi:MAG: VOC family protein [Dehalococcoidia bacterium]
MVKAIPDEYHTVQPYVIVKGAAKFIDFMTAAFGAQEKMRMGGPEGPIGHAEVQIGDSVIMLADSTDDIKPMPTTILLYMEDCDAVYKQALAAGATSEREPEDMFYGDRAAGVNDAFGNRWFIHTHIEDVSPEEMGKRQAAMAQN